MKKFKHCLLVFCVLLLVYHPASAQWNTDTTTFEFNTTNIIIDTTAGNLWQIGHPQKSNFDSAYSGIQAILTDTLNFYPPNDTSSFIYIVRNPYTQTCGTCLTFWHKYEMDTMGDRGFIEASYDGANSWLVLKDTFVDGAGASFYWLPDHFLSSDTFAQHKTEISGNSGGWVKSSFCWYWWIPVKSDTIIIMPDSLMLRFTFISDSITNTKDGWMIDNLVAAGVVPENCSGIEENQEEIDIAVYPNPASNTITIDAKKRQDLNMCLLDLAGRCMLVFNTSQSITNVDVSNMMPGIYFLILSSPDWRIQKKIVIE